MTRIIFDNGSDVVFVFMRLNLIWVVKLQIYWYRLVYTCIFYAVVNYSGCCARHDG